MPLVSQTFDQLLDFTRTTSGTFVGSNGLVQNTPASVNLLTWTQQFDNAAWSKNAATVTANTTVAPDGTSTADKLAEDNTNSNHAAFTTITTGSGAHTVSFFVKAAERTWCYVGFNGAGASAYFNLSTGAVGTTAGILSSSITSAGNGWWRCAVTVSLTAGSNFPFVRISTGDNVATYTGTTGSGIFIWGAQVEAASAATTYTRNNGGVYPPCFDYDPVTLAAKGLLIEEQRTNLALQSETFDSGTWNKGGATVTANATVSPDGTADADALVEDAATSAHFCQQFLSFTTATAYTFSTYVKAGTRTWCLLQFPTSAFGASTGSFFNLSGAGALGAAVGSPTARTITAVGNGWYRVTITATSTATAGGNVPISAASADNTNSYTGVAGAEAIYLYGAQLEAGAFATSYIPTVASQVTRTADQCSIVAPNFAPWYNQAEGSWVASFSPYAVTGSLVAQISTSDNNNRIQLINASSGQIAVTTGSVGQGTIDAGTIIAGATNNLAYAYRTNDTAASLNGGAAVADSTVALPVVDRLSIGSTVVPAGFLNGHIRSIRYYPTRLSDAQLQALTA